jgi:uncharacterized protein (TIGR00661 family)
MNRSWVVFYISSHGFGHMTRCLAIIEEILEKTNYKIYIACGKLQNDFAKIYLKGHQDRLLFREVITDIGLVNFRNSLTVDKNQLERELLNFIEVWEVLVSEELHVLSNLQIKIVISDISPIGALVGERLKAKNVGISNFTWVDQYENLAIDQDIIDKFIYAYSKLNYFIEYELALPMQKLNIPRIKAGFFSRKIDFKKVNEINMKYGRCIFITCGKSANLENINIKNYDGFIFTTSGVNIIGSNNVIKLPTNTLDTQNYIAASSIVIAKAGWSTISEAITAKRNLVLIEREDVIEDTHNIKELKKGNLAISIKETDLYSLDLLLIEQKINKCISFKKLNEYENQKNSIIRVLDF